VAGQNGPSGEGLLLLAALVSLQLAQGRSADELELISAFFEALGDNLALIAARRSMPGRGACGGAENTVEFSSGSG